MRLEEIINSHAGLGHSKKLELLNVSNILCTGAFNVEFIQSNLNTGFALALSDNKDLLKKIKLTVCDNELQIELKAKKVIIAGSKVKYGKSIVNGGQNFAINQTINNPYAIISASGENSQAALNINNENSLQASKRNILTGKLKIFVVLPRLEYLKLTGSGSFSCTNIQADFLRLNLAGAGDINIHGKAKSIDVNLSGSGKINLKKLISDTAQLKLSGSGKIKSHVVKSVTAKVTGVGDIEIYGNPDEKISSITGVGKIKAKKQKIKANNKLV